MSPHLSLPRIAILGRPNVGKSTFFNRLVGRRAAIVEDQPGVTRDWQEIPVTFWGLHFLLMDTPGLIEERGPTLPQQIWDHTTRALQEVDLFLLMIDSRDGVLPADQELANWVRRTGKPVIVLANKCEAKRALGGLWEAHQLGLGDPLPISAAHGEGLVELADRLQETLSFPSSEDEGPEEERPLKIGIVGRPNVGKSTLVNRLVKKERMLAGPEAGLTRDSIEIPWEFQGRSLVLVDTAGLRKAARVDSPLEKMATSDTLKTIHRAHVVIVVMDALQAFERQDCLISARVAEEGRVLILALNKWDQVKDPEKTLERLRQKAGRVLPQVKGVPLVPLSALEGKGINSLMKRVFQMEKMWKTRISTGALNRFLEQMLTAHQPPLVKGRRIKLKYMTQVRTAPPTFVLFGNQISALPGAYQGYLLNGIREHLKISGIPLRLLLKSPSNPFDTSSHT
ncbi:MAG: ribosome biogenesis GTPase Der [Holosporales bacterium]|jgi:GTP-binding protein